MSDILIIIGIVVAIGAVVTLSIWLRRRPRRLKVAYFQTKWQEMQKLCSDKQNWPQAILAADKILDEALKKKRFSGKSMGERLTKAQRLLSNNEAVWFGHKLRNKLHDDPQAKLKEKEVKQALLGIRQALKDLGALPERKTEPAAQKESTK
jgi:FtsZ-interacting cell division protein ZipA